MKKKNKFRPTDRLEKDNPVVVVKEEIVKEKKAEKRAEIKQPKVVEEHTKLSSLKDVLKLLRTNIPVFFIISVLAFAVYWKVIKGEFLNIDDLAGIVQNPIIRDLKTALGTGLFHQMYYALVFKFFGLNSTAFHISSVVLHIVNCTLVFLLTYMLFGKKISIIATALFTVNPTGSEAINWLSAAGYLHQTSISIVSLILFILYRRSKDPWYLISTVVLFGFNLLLYRTAWALEVPFLIIIIDVLLLNSDLSFKKIFKFIPVYLPFIVLSLIFTFSEVVKDFQERAYTLETQHYLSIKTATPYLNRLPYSIFMIGRQYVYPERLTIYHEGRIIGNVEYTAMIVSSLIYIALVIYLLKKNKTYAALLVLIPTTTLPSFSPVAIAWLVAERYLYFGVTFFCILVAKILVDLEPKIHLKNATKVFSIIIFIIYFARTFVRADEFSSSKKLWLSTMKAAPLSYRVYNNLGDVYANEGQYELAIENFKKSLELKPDYADAVHNMGFTYMQMGDVNKARYYLQKSFEMNPRLYQSLFKLGYIEMQLGNLEGAKYYFQKCLEVNPSNPEAQQILNNIMAAQAATKPTSLPASQ
jgi:tetratricopeptide (TPR) repeat protein